MSGAWLGGREELFKEGEYVAALGRFLQEGGNLEPDRFALRSAFVKGLLPLTGPLGGKVKPPCVLPCKREPARKLTHWTQQKPHVDAARPALTRLDCVYLLSDCFLPGTVSFSTEMGFAGYTRKTIKVEGLNNMSYLKSHKECELSLYFSISKKGLVLGYSECPSSLVHPIPP